MKIAVGCDEAAFALKERVKGLLEKMGHQVTDMGSYDTSPVFYPDKAVAVAEEIASGRCERGILLCGTGIGMAMTANKVKGVRAAVCHDLFSTERSILSNDAQIMCMGARVIAPELALRLVELWLGLRFQGGSSQQKLSRLGEYEARNFK